MIDTQGEIVRIIRKHAGSNEVLSDWRGLTLRQVLADMSENHGTIVFWGHWTETELNTVFQGK